MDTPAWATVTLAGTSITQGQTMMLRKLDIHVQTKVDLDLTVYTTIISN
jgi:hypothetical protein